MADAAAASRGWDEGGAPPSAATSERGSRGGDAAAAVPLGPTLVMSPRAWFDDACVGGGGSYSVSRDSAAGDGASGWFSDPLAGQATAFVCVVPRRA